MSKEFPEVDEIWVDKGNNEIKIHILDVFSEDSIRFIKTKRCQVADCSKEWILENYEYYGKAENSIDEFFNIKEERVK